MINDMTDSVRATNTRARISALVVDACFAHWAFAVHHALRPTSYVRISIVIRNASTRSSVKQFLANSICSTGVSSARTLRREIGNCEFRQCLNMNNEESFILLFGFS
jgi:3-dehydroquinate dehydratase